MISQPSDIELERMCQKRDNNEQLQLQFIIRKKILGRDTTVGRSSNLRVEQRKESLIDAEGNNTTIFYKGSALIAPCS